MTRITNAVVHVMHDRPPTLGEYRRPLGKLWVGLGVAGFACIAALLVPFAMSAPALAGWDGWRSVNRNDGALALQDAVPAGQERDLPLYACRAVINQEMHIGRIRPDFSGCHVGYDGHEVEYAPYEVLSAFWRPASDGLSNAFGAGSERTAGSETQFDMVPLYVCRAAYQGGIHAGQVKSGEKSCSFGFGGKKIVATTYDVLQANPWMAWVLATARNLPDTAIVGGSEGGEPLYACRAADREGLHPGKIKRKSAGCSVASEGKEVVVERFEVLVARWIAGRTGNVPVSAYAAGQENGNSQFVCRAQSRDSMQIGKVNEGLGGCHIGMLGREVVIPEYEVLAR